MRRHSDVCRFVSLWGRPLMAVVVVVVVVGGGVVAIIVAPMCTLISSRARARVVACKLNACSCVRVRGTLLKNPTTRA